MANYSYDEAGNMAAYFLLTFLSIILIPLTLSSFSPSRKPRVLSGCQCGACLEQAESIRRRERGSVLSPKFRRRTFCLAAGWALVAYLVYKVTTTQVENKVYDPFEVLGLGTGVDVKTIKSHYKKLSRKFHPDKVKLSVNETIEMVEAKFVEITKAYKSLTDETIRKNWQMYGHPDGRQEVSMGIALPKWIVESGNNIWVLGAYGLLFGGALPALVGRWWFGNRDKTKDGVKARSAAAFFKSLNEDSSIDEVVAGFVKAFEWERPKATVSKRESELDDLEEQIKERLKGKWNELNKLAEATPGEHETRRRAFILLYAHLLRIPVKSPSLRQEQTDVLLQTPTLLNSMLNISISRNWLQPTLAVMRLHAYLAQAISPGQDNLRLAQFPGVSPDEAATLVPPEGKDAVSGLVDALEGKSDGRVSDVKKAVQRWGRAELVGATLRVFGERYITPQSYINIVLKLRLSPPGAPHTNGDAQADAKSEEQRVQEFLAGKKDMEDLPGGDGVSYAHAPYWPARRKPSWWAVMSDTRSNRIMIAPMKISDIPMGPRYRMYRQQFQGPPQSGLNRWRLHLISDTFVGEEIVHDIEWRIEDPDAVNVVEMEGEDEISEPEEDSLAGQMALMRGGSVKQHDGESDDESTTDDDRDRDSEAESSSSSDSD
ncbi:Sec63 Brl domain-containing protein [Fomitopsis serialis]|uniref:Sec63 Brl domain-containing protein n=1 Tax=Fomitopsis serialis TaxID=139415 RepID=UPI0020084424|nr:Sec63 Brl domain-containing protein [Neoantrodia serialis]KAH9928945.1 Sec63 Brl domain-containing protein [Neoantrodia serialis]